MLVLYLIILMFTNTLNTKQTNIHLIFINRVTVIIFFISILLNLNILYFQSIGKGISIYNGLFQVSIQTQIIEIFFLLVGLFIISGWANKFYLVIFPERNSKEKLSDLYNIPGNQINKDYSILNTYPLHKRNEKELVWYKSDQYSLVAIFSIIGGTLLMSSLDLLSMYLSIELQSFSLYVLATLNKDKLSATSAGLKYFLLGGLSSCFILLGSAIIYSYTGLTHFESLHSLISVSLTNGINEALLSIQNTKDVSNVLLLDIQKAFSIGFIIILIGFLFKVSAAPFYQWSPDVYESTPTIVTVWLTIMAKLTIFIFLLNFFEFSFLFPVEQSETFLSSSFSFGSVGFGSIDSDNTISVWNQLKDNVGNYSISYPAQYGKNLLLMSSLLSLIIGTISGLSQHKIKRLLAFSSVSHVGFLLLALSIYSVKSIESFIFYLVQYSITSLNIFLIILAMGYLINRFIYHSAPLSPHLPSFTISSSSSMNGSKEAQKGDKGLKFKETDLNYLSELKGQLNNNYILSFSLAVCLFSMAGVPPLMGFFGKQFVLYSSIEDGNIFLSFVAILVSVISASYYLKIVNYSFFSTGSGHTDTNINLFTSLSLSSFYSPTTKAKKKSLDINEKEKTNASTLFLSEREREQKNESTLTILNINQIHSFIISFLTFTIILFFTQPSILLNCSSYIALTIFNI